MQRYWVSWWSGNYADEGCTKPPFRPFVSGYKDSQKDEDKDLCSFCTLMEAKSEDDIWKLVDKHYPDYEERFCELVADDYMPNNRFPGATVYRIES